MAISRQFSGLHDFLEKRRSSQVVIKDITAVLNGALVHEFQGFSLNNKLSKFHEKNTDP